MLSTVGTSGMRNGAGAPRISRVGVLLVALKYVEGVELPLGDAFSIIVALATGEGT